jgi:hypothetical protein
MPGFGKTKREPDMKKLVLTVMSLAALAIGSINTRGEGTIQFENFTPNIGGLVHGNSIPSLSGATLASGPATFELFYGLVGSTVTQLVAGTGTGFGDVVFSFTMFTNAPGKFIDGAIVTTLEPAGTGTADPTINVALAIAGWTGSYTNYAAALTGLAPLIGITGAFGNPTGGAGVPPATPASLVDWTAAGSLILVPTPEPATLVLGGLGAAALLLFHRRK